MAEDKKYNFIESLSGEGNADAKAFANLALCKLKEEKNITTLADAKFFLPPHSSFGHRKLPSNWKDGYIPVETTNTVESGSECYPSYL